MQENVYTSVSLNIFSDNLKRKNSLNGDECPILVGCSSQEKVIGM